MRVRREGSWDPGEFTHRLTKVPSLDEHCQGGQDDGEDGKPQVLNEDNKVGQDG